MATRSGGISGAVFALVAFVFLFVLSGALAVLFYTQKTAAQEEVATLQDQQGNLISQTERGGDMYSSLNDQRRQQGRTIFGQLVVNNQNLKRWLTGDGTMPLGQIEQQLQAAEVPQGSNVLAQVQQLNASLTSAQQQIDQLEQGNQQRAQKLASLQEQNEQQQDAHEQTVSNLQVRIDELQQSFSQAEQAAQQEREELRQTYEQYKTDTREELRQKESEIRTLDNEIAKRDARVRELLGIINANRLSSPDLTLEADGQIVEVVTGEQVVYINLGRDENLVLGMTFEVFDAETGVRTEVRNNGQVQHIGGKATIEVIRFSESGQTAACRVIRRSYGEPILSGDLISNIVYDENRTFRFFVTGDFDLNQDGRATEMERRRATNLIQQWGGVVIDSDDMPVDTDFLVIGEQLEFPEPPPDNPPPTPAEIQEWLGRKERYIRQQELIGLARELSIPILNQNRFLTLIGYYQQ